MATRRSTRIHSKNANLPTSSTRVLDFSDIDSTDHSCCYAFLYESVKPTPRSANVDSSVHRGAHRVKNASSSKGHPRDRRGRLSMVPSDGRDHSRLSRSLVGRCAPRDREEGLTGHWPRREPIKSLSVSGKRHSPALSAFAYPLSRLAPPLLSPREENPRGGTVMRRTDRPTSVRP